MKNNTSSISDLIEKITIVLGDLPRFIFIFIFVVLGKITSVIFGFLSQILEEKLGHNLVVDNSSWQDILLFGVLLAPILETAIFQVGMFGILSSIRFIRSRKALIVLIGGVIFGIAHSYNSVYIVAMIPFGILLMYAYIIRLRKEDAFLSVFCIHLVFNLISLLLKIAF